MAYSTQEDLLEQITEAAMIQLTDDSNAGTVDAAAVARAIADADAEIDGYVSARMAVPLDPIPAIIRKCSVDIAIFNLYGRRETTPEDRQTRRDNAVKLLTAISKGIVTLGEEDPSAGGGGNAAEVADTNPVKVFGRGNLESL